MTAQVGKRHLLSFAALPPARSGAGRIHVERVGRDQPHFAVRRAVVLIAVLACLMRWMYAPQQRRYLYLAMFFLRFVRDDSPDAAAERHGHRSGDHAGVSRAWAATCFWATASFGWSVFSAT